jgi:raffinose/stachyose/melibiose transport system substrate-binding protein
VSELHDRVRLASSRRSLLKAAGGLAAASALATPFALRGSSASAQDEVNLTIWNNHPEWRDPLDELLSAFEAENPGVNLELTAIPGPDYPARLQTAIAGEQPPDLIGLLEGALFGDYRPDGNEPYIDLTGVVDPSLLIDGARIQVEHDGRVYGVPLASYTVGLAVNNTIAAEQGITSPSTWDELTAVSQQLLDAGVTPLTIGARDGIHPFFMYIGLASALLGPDGFEELRRGERALTDPDVLEAANYLVSLQPYLNIGFEATDYVTAKALFAQGQSAMMVAGTADFTGFQQENPDADLSFIPWPGPEAGTYATNTGYELIYTVSRFSSPENQEAASQFVAWLASEQAQTLVAESIALPIASAVTELSDPIKQETVAVRDRDVTVWYGLPETQQTFSTIAEIQGGLWTGDLTPEAFAEQTQAVIQPSGD